MSGDGRTEHERLERLLEDGLIEGYDYVDVPPGAAAPDGEAPVAGASSRGIARRRYAARHTQRKAGRSS